MTNTIARTTVPQVLLKDYDKIAKTNGNNVIDTAKEVEKFKDKVNDAYNYGEITLDMAKEMGFEGHRTQEYKTFEYAENGGVIGRGICPLPLVRSITSFAGTIVGAVVGSIYDTKEAIQENLFGKKNNDLIGTTQEDCSLLHDRLIRREIISSR